MQLYAFGRNQYGELGNSANEKTLEPNPTPTLVSLPGSATIDTMSRGAAALHTLVVVADLAVATGSLPAGTKGAHYSGQVQATGGALPYKWTASDLPPGLSIDPPSDVVSGTPTAVGSYTVTVTVTDSDGIQASAKLAITILPPPRITNARQSASVWRGGGGLARISRTARASRRRPPVGTRFSFAMNGQAAVTFSFTRKVEGRQVGMKCVAMTRSNARRKPCKRTITAGTLAFTNHKSTNKVAFQGRLSRSKRLNPGRYTLIISATNTARARSAPVSLTFTIVT